MHLRGRTSEAVERVRREVRLDPAFGDVAFANAFASFAKMYNVAPLRAYCAPDVFARYCEVFGRSSDTHRHATRLQYDGVPLVAAILKPGTLALEGEVDETHMGDW